MAEDAIKLKVPKEVFQDTLGKLTQHISDLQTKRNYLQTQINRMSGATFSGTDVDPAIEAAKEALKRVDKAIVKVTAQRTNIENYLSGTETAKDTLASGIRNDVTSQLPPLFA